MYLWGLAASDAMVRKGWGFANLCDCMMRLKDGSTLYGRGNSYVCGLGRVASGELQLRNWTRRWLCDKAVVEAV